MKRIIIISLCLASIFTVYAQEDCDTLKLKTIKTNYGHINGSSFNIIGDLNGSIINIDTFPVFNSEVLFVNISNDTFSSNVTYQILIYCLAYADTGLITGIYALTPLFEIGKSFFPDDTVRIGIGIKIDLLSIINEVEKEGIDFEQISHWETISGVCFTSKDEVFTERVFYAGADTATFYVVKTPVNIHEIENKQADIFVFPNPTKGQLIIENRELSIEHITVYDLGGKILKQIINPSQEINLSDLASGIYLVKVKTIQGEVVQKIIKN
jgi:hypothetical protein